jgi:hypothetical protein
MYGLGWRRLTADAEVYPGPVLLAGVVLLASVAGGDVTIYDGADPTSGDKLFTLKADANISLPVVFPWPVRCEKGLYVDIGSNITEVTVFYVPAKLDGSNPMYGGPPAMEPPKR